MGLVRLLIMVIAGLAVSMGLLWIGQGLGIIMWPASSFMLADRQWAYNGAILAAVGLLAIVLLRRSGGQRQ